MGVGPQRPVFAAGRRCARLGRRPRPSSVLQRALPQGGAAPWPGRTPDSPPRPPRRPHRRGPEAPARKRPPMHTLDMVDAGSLRPGLPEFRAGDTLKVHVRVVEGNKSRIQVFQGVVIRRQGAGVRATFTVRKVSYGVGVERTFPLHTPVIERIEVVSRGSVRRAKLYYLRDLRG